MISIMLTLWAGLSITFAGITWVVSKNVAHEIQAAISVLIATVALVGVGIIEQLKKMEKTRESSQG